MTAPEDPRAAGWPVPEEAVQAAVDASPTRRDHEPGWWRDEATAVVNAVAPHIVAATLRQAAERLRQAWTIPGGDEVALRRALTEFDPDDEADRLLVRWADEVQP